MRLGLLKTAGFGRLKTGGSAYKKPGFLITNWYKRWNHPPSNYANRKESFGFLLTRRAPVDSLRTEAALDFAFGRTPIGITGDEP